MKIKDKKDLQQFITALKVAEGLRCFPNGRNLDIKDSVKINQIGKAIEHIRMVVQDMFIKGKSRQMDFYAIVDCRKKLNELFQLRGLKEYEKKEAQK